MQRDPDTHTRTLRFANWMLTFVLRYLFFDVIVYYAIEHIHHPPPSPTPSPTPPLPSNPMHAWQFR